MGSTCALTGEPWSLSCFFLNATKKDGNEVEIEDEMEDELEDRIEDGMEASMWRKKKEQTVNRQ
jgi:hypothetical protein